MILIHRWAERGLVGDSAKGAIERAAKRLGFNYRRISRRAIVRKDE
jgi:hypothetical protein